MSRRRWALTRQRLAEAASYVSEHLGYTLGGTPIVADLYETPERVRRTLTRLYGTPQVPGDGETAYWFLDDDGRAIGREGER